MQVDTNSSNVDMGFASVNNNSGWHSCNSGGNFSFRKRLERIDWRKIAAIDVDRISRELDFDSLQENIANVAFCNIECELDSRFIDPNYVKLFKLAQLIVEYLLHSQDYLSHTVVALEEKCKYLTSEVDKERSGKEANESTIKALKDDIKKYKKIICSHQNNPVQTQPTECHSCPFCPKIFLTSEYLQMHVKRRHIDACSSDTQNQVSQVVDKLEKEVSQLKERLKTTECQLLEERNLKQSEQITLDIQKWKRQQLESQKKDIEAIRDLFMKEMRELNERTLFNEHCVNNLQRELQDVCTSPPLSPAQICKPSNEEPCDLLKGQKKEFCKLKKHLAQQVEDVVCRHLQDRENMLEAKIKCIVKEQNQEFEKLNCLVRDKFTKPDANLIQTDCLLQNLCDRTKEQEKQLKKQQKKIQELMCKPQAIPPCTDESEKEKCKEKTEICTKHKKNSDSNSADTLNLSPRSAQWNEARRRNRSLVQGIRNELSTILHEKLENLGIGVSTQSSIEDEVFNEFVEKFESGKIDAIKELRKSKRLSTKTKRDLESKQSRSSSLPSGWTDDDDYEECYGRVKTEYVTQSPKEKGLTRSPSLPNTFSQHSEGEWQRKIAKQSRFSSTKESLTKLVTSVKKKFKPHKFWHAVPQSTPIVAESKKDENMKVIRQNSEPVVASALNKSESVTESEESASVSSDDEYEEEEDDIHEEAKPDEQIQIPQTPKTRAKDDLEIPIQIPQTPKTCAKDDLEIPIQIPQTPKTRVKDDLEIPIQIPQTLKKRATDDVLLPLQIPQTPKKRATDEVLIQLQIQQTLKKRATDDVLIPLQIPQTLKMRATDDVLIPLQIPQTPKKRATDEVLIPLQVPQTPKKRATDDVTIKTESSSDWESPNEITVVREKPPVQTSARLFTVLPQKSSKAATSQLVQKIETQLNTQRQKPFGGIDTIDIKQKQKNSMEPPSDFDDSSDEEKDVIKNKKSGSSGFDSKRKPTKNEQTTVHKLSAWSSDDDVSEIT